MRWILLIFLIASLGFCDTINERYDTKIILRDDNYAHVIVTLSLRNPTPRKITPGFLQIEVSSLVEGGVLPFLPTKKPYTQPLKIENLIVKDKHGLLNSSVRKIGDHTYITYNVFEPLQPYERRIIRISYDTKFPISGFLFKLFEYRIASDVNSKLEVIVPPGTYISYAPNAKLSKNTAIWQGSGLVTLEFTKLPLRNLPYRGTYMFWSALLMLLLLWFLYSERKHVLDGIDDTYC